MQYAQMISGLQSPEAMDQLARLYGSRDGMIVSQKARYTNIVKRHESVFGAKDGIRLISAPGRTEIGGNHTDHNRGRVLAAAINLDALAAVSPRSDMLVHLNSEGYEPLTIDLNDLTVKKAEQGTTAALICGVAARLAETGKKIGGFDAVVTSTVAGGSGLSSSAAFEVLVCAIFDELYNGWSIDFKERAKIGQYAENVFFGKPSGLLDQMASSAGGLAAIDFKHDDPTVTRMNYSFEKHGYSLVVVRTGGSHADLTPCYAAIPAEMRMVAAEFGEQNLRRVRMDEFLQKLPELYGKVPDRAILRAVHFYTENQRVVRQAEALQNDDLDAFFREIIESGRSSFMYLQNVYASADTQPLSVALAAAETELTGHGAWRIHGGGFAGTTLNFVPSADAAAFTARMESLFGARCCHTLSIRPEGAYVLKL